MQSADEYPNENLDEHLPDIPPPDEHPNENPNENPLDEHPNENPNENPPDEHPPVEPPNEHSDEHPPNEGRDEIEFIPGSEQHITEAFLNAKFGDDESIRIRGELRSLELFILQHFKPLTNCEDVLGFIRTVKTNARTQVNELSRGREEPQVLVPHALRRNRNNSYSSVPQKVARACNEAMNADNADNEDTDS